MSFSTDIKEEILKKMNNNLDDCCKVAEKFGEYLTQTDKKYMLNVDFSSYLDISKIKECCMKNIIKGAFLSTGYIAPPQSDYHFEITFRNRACADYMFNLLSLLEFTPKIMKRKNALLYSLYIKDSTQISLLISVIGADSCLLRFEEIRVEKEVKNNINRTTNCQVANLSKTILSANIQINAIKKIKESGIYKNLDEKLKLTCDLRLKYKDKSLDYIASKTSGDEKVSKSGLKHRLDKIVEIASKL